MVSKAGIVKTGAAAKAAVAKVGTIASKCGLAKVAGACAKIAGASSIAVGTTVVAAGLFVLFVGVVWIVKRVIKKAGEFIDTLSAAHDAEDAFEGLLATV